MASSTQSDLAVNLRSRNTEHHWRFVRYAERAPAMKLREPARAGCLTMAARESVGLEVFDNMNKTILKLRTRARCDKNITHEQRINLLTEALAIKPDSPELLVHRAYCHHLAGDPEAMDLDICTAIALAPDMALSFYGTPAVEGRFFRALARGSLGYIQGAVSDLRICLKVLQGYKALQDAQQELTFWESYLNGPHDAGKDSPVAEACSTREALAVFLAQEARAKAPAVFQLLLMKTVQQAALSIKKTGAPDSPRSVTVGPGSTAPSSPPESPRSADLAPAQHISASAPSTCSQEAPVQPNLQQLAFAPENIPMSETADQHENGQGRSTSIQPSNTSSPEPAKAAQQRFEEAHGMTTRDMAHALLAVPLWACSRCTPQWVQNKVIMASSIVINVAAAMAAVTDYCKKAACT
ncbi:hypothetical protein COCOBI_03-2720 [Coccomyxa sp. Obi]|nr:hypothetical protein COCOBI_03-2720 [Coccomyxa sp. Obi]